MWRWGWSTWSTVWAEVVAGGAAGATFVLVVALGALGHVGAPRRAVAVLTVCTRTRTPSLRSIYADDNLPQYCRPRRCSPDTYRIRWRCWSQPYIPCTYNRRKMLQIPFPLGDPGSRSIQGSLVPPESTSQTAPRLAQLFQHSWWLCPADSQIDTDRPRCVSNNMPHLVTCHIHWRIGVKKV